MSRPVDVGDLKEGQYVIIDNEPCQIVEITKSKPGKHGSAKARVVAMGVFDGVKRSFVKPVDAKVDVPIIEKRSGQVIAVLENSIQLMDLETYEVFETPMPQEENVRSKLANGAEVEYWRIMGKTKVVRVKGG
ncbi:MAG: translation initiation factor IF-5A [Candidatus Bathyarchaeia archaeon]|nr:translation initiation factor IF-5A [Candidatus Bathyarchaeota archaeon]